MLKTCTKCGEEKEETEYYSQHGKGLQAQCKECVKNRVKARTDVVGHSRKDREKVRVRNRKYYAENPEKFSLRSKAAYKKQMQENPEHRRKLALLWIKNNPEKANANTTRRRAVRLRAVPGWDKELTEFTLKEAHILSKLREKATGVKWNVDHVIPLRSELVCGLHVWNNFQVITATENFRKNNRWWPDMPTNTGEEVLCPL